MPWLWLLIILTLSVVEACTVQMVSIWFVAGAIAALVLSFFVPSALVQVCVFVVVTLLVLFLTKPLVKKALSFTKEDINLGRYVGKIGVVICEINNTLGEGQVKVLGSVWTAKSNNNSIIKVGENVKIEAINGVKLIVSEV